jgi:hypothetical protein
MVIKHSADPVETYMLGPWKITVGQDNRVCFYHDDALVGDELELVKLYEFLRITLPKPVVAKHRYYLHTGFYQKE